MWCYLVLTDAPWTDIVRRALHAFETIELSEGVLMVRANMSAVAILATVGLALPPGSPILVVEAGEDRAAQCVNPAALTF